MPRRTELPLRFPHGPLAYECRTPNFSRMPNLTGDRAHDRFLGAGSANGHRGRRRRAVFGRIETSTGRVEMRVSFNRLAEQELIAAARHLETEARLGVAFLDEYESWERQILAFPRSCPVVASRDGKTMLRVLRVQHGYRTTGNCSHHQMRLSSTLQIPPNLSGAR
jgi:hypothetical protein